MALVWGAYEGSPGIRAGIDLTVSGTTITAKYYVGNEFSYDDDQTSNRTGAITGSTNFHNGGGSGSTTLISTQTRTGSRGTTYSFGHNISGVFNGATPSVSASITVPGTEVEVPDTIVGLTTTNITSNSAVANWNPPASWNGDNTGYYDVQYFEADDYSGTEKIIGVNGATSRTLPDLKPNTNYEWRVRAKNSAGVGAWSGNRAFTTAAGVPGQSNMPQVSTITPTTARVTAGNATPNGSPITGYQVQIDNNSGFTSPTVDVNGSAQTYDVEGLTHNTLYYVRSRAKNAVGWGPWSAANQFTTKVLKAYTPTFQLDTATSIIVNWTLFSAETAGDIWYTVQLSSDPSFGSVQQGSNLQVGTYKFTGLTAGTLYYARVRANTAEGAGEWSEVASSTTTTSDDYIRKSGSWRPASWYEKVAGTWRVSTMNIRKSGTWRS